jgi:DNA-binding NarL/FixJ family response regulator
MKTLIIEEYPAILQGLKCNLQHSNYTFEVSTYSSIHELEIPLDFLTNDIVVLGVPHFVPVLFKWIDKIRLHSSIPILIYGVDQASPILERLMSMNVQGIVTKQYDFSRFSETLFQSAANDTKHTLQFGFQCSRYTDFKLNNLSHREVEIVDLIAHEKTTHEISDVLHISISTVENHRKNIFRKMGVKNLAGLVLTANRVGYI